MVSFPVIERVKYSIPPMDTKIVVELGCAEVNSARDTLKQV
ncbi:unnamed protein product [marine sediment metagenome]|uniref:Uncharacterized protein n=1 Tax=marine sediment metagenome TaxID=412755 RepID=X0WHZ6_9ZZZZ